ncbi:MAG: hypothetical protein LPK14_13285 [Hymenobacteraceae bacterium]|nr:hypothetical protein [Hymenobacteraceae bacterium]
MKKTLLSLAVTLAAIQGVSAQEQQAPQALELRPAQVSVLPGVGTNGKHGARYYQPFSFNLLGGSNGGVNGFELGGILNVDKAFARGLQIGGVANLVGGPVRGVQVGGILNTSTDASGLQVGGIANIGTGNAKGAQIAGITNIIKGEANGLQVAGIVNTAPQGVTGAQVSGVVNIAGKAKGLQLSTVNKAKVVRGLQLGVVNIADSAHATLGLVNIVRKNGYYRGEVWAGETFFGNAAFKMGTKRLYTMLALGWRQEDAIYHVAYGAGIGSELGKVAGFTLSADLLSYQVSEDELWTDRSTNQLQQVRLLAARELKGNTALLAGATFNVFESSFTADGRERGMDIAPWHFYSKVHRNTRVTLWPGVNMGFRF